MTDPIPDLIARVRELDAAATKGPWDSEYDGDRYGFLGYVIVVDTCYEEHATDAALIACYRAAAPLLADECERLRERVAELEGALKSAVQRGLRAPCVWCGYNGPGYWQPGTHAAACPWHSLGGEAERSAALKGGE